MHSPRRLGLALALTIFTLLVAFAAAATTSTSNKTTQIIPEGQLIENAQYEINLQGNHEIQIALLKIKNLSKVASSYFIHIIHESVADKVAFVKGYLETEPDHPYTATRFIPDFDLNPSLPKLQSHRYYSVQYPTPIEPGNSIEFFIRTAFHRTMVPFPLAITQGAKQRMLYTGFTNFFSLYPIKSYTTTIYTNSGAIESWTPRRNAEKNDNAINYRLTTVDQPKPFDLGDILSVHAQNHSPFYCFTSAERSFDVSNNGQIAVRENYYVEHIGSKLQGPFHRSSHDRQQYHVQQGMQQPGPEIVNFIAFLPENANNIDFRDFNGNISTSRVLVQRDATLLDFQLRFPLFGGWKSDFELGYDYVEGSILESQQKFKLQGEDKVTLTLPYGYPFNDATGDELVLNILLPEGATDIQWEAPFDVESITTSIVTSYKDTVGRTQVTLKSRNVVANMWDLIHITYQLPSSTSLLARGPPRVVYLIGGAVAVIFILMFGNFGFGSYNVIPVNSSVSTSTANSSSESAASASQPQEKQATFAPDVDGGKKKDEEVVSKVNEETTTKINKRKSTTKK